MPRRFRALISNVRVTPGAVWPVANRSVNDAVLDQPVHFRISHISAAHPSSLRHLALVEVAIISVNVAVPTRPVGIKMTLEAPDVPDHHGWLLINIPRLQVERRSVR